MKTGFAHRHQPIHADFSGGQITSAGLLPLLTFDQRHHLTRELVYTPDANGETQLDRILSAPVTMLPAWAFCRLKRELNSFSPKEVEGTGS